jgi:hypothetical protein
VGSVRRARQRWSSSRTHPPAVVRRRRPTPPACQVATGAVQFHLRNKPTALKRTLDERRVALPGRELERPRQGAGRAVDLARRGRGVAVHLGGASSDTASAKSLAPGYFLFGDNAKTGDGCGAKDVKPGRTPVEGATLLPQGVGSSRGGAVGPRLLQAEGRIQRWRGCSRIIKLHATS